MNLKQNSSNVKSANIPGETTAKLINVKVKPNCTSSRIVSQREDLYIVELSAPPLDNKANLALVKLLSKHFGCRVRIKSGLNSKNKRVLLG
ncbi:MAG: DUF167 domain-containing protein [Candidatus Cloacimonetes bacterium]|nr:DUF167 domain-containing protein [Candidatus Cloacimonadota bacterium]